MDYGVGDGGGVFAVFGIGGVSARVALDFFANRDTLVAPEANAIATSEVRVCLEFSLKSATCALRELAYFRQLSYAFSS